MKVERGVVDLKPAGSDLSRISVKGQVVLAFFAQR